MKKHIRIGKTQICRGALDYSHLLDAPAGKHGFVKVKNGHFYFEDGLRARFLALTLLPVPIRLIMPPPKSWPHILPAWGSM